MFFSNHFALFKIAYYIRNQIIYKINKNKYKLRCGRNQILAPLENGIKNHEINLVINTPMGSKARYDEESIGRACIQKGILAITTLSGASAAVRAIRLIKETITVKSIQEYHC